ncbi:folate-binding protein, partial [Pseudomonas aeruginosa]|nr:folate-binding protein [Pseudomonas aeruginosa]
VHSTSVGEVVLAARTPENSVELLAVLQDDAVADGRISLGSAEGAPLVLLNLPYTLDSDREIQR